MRLTRLIPAAVAVSALLMTGACQRKAANETASEPAAETASAAACARPADPAKAAAEMAAAEAKAIAAATASRGAGQPAMWTLKDADTTIYILGTVHLLRPEQTWRTPEIEAAIAAADTVVFEADTTGPDAERVMTEFSIAKGLYSDGTQLSSLLTEGERARLTEALKEVDLPIEALQPMRPWFAAINISVMQMMEEGFDPSSGVEMQIEGDVAARGVRFDYLETVDQQLGEFAGLDTCAQVEFLMQTAESLNQGTEVLDLLVDEWADGDTAGLAALMASREAFGSDAAYDALLKNRNERWTPLIAGMLDEPGTRLIAVGAGHLAGEDSVIAMLRAEGLDVAGP